MKVAFRLLALMVAFALVHACTPDALTGTSKRELVYPPLQTQIGVGVHGSPDEAVQLQALGVKHTRLTFWTKLDSPQYEREHEARMSWLRAHGVEPLVVVHDFFPYAILPDTMLARLAARFPGTTWQILNESDVLPGWRDGRIQLLYRGYDYAYLMYFTAAAMRRADPTVKLVGMGMAGHEGEPWHMAPGWVQVDQFTKEYLATPWAPMLDAWAIHVYGGPLANVLEAKVLSTRRALNGKMPLWVTEIGMDRANAEGAFSRQWTAAQVDSVQSAETMKAIAKANELGIERLFIYQLWTADDDGFGLLRADAVTTRPVYTTLQAYLNGH